MADTPLYVPSGQDIVFQEMVADKSAYGLSFHFRFVAPEIGGPGRAFEDVVTDMETLCNEFALPRIASTGPQPSQIVISLAAEATEFGQPSPDITQFFEAYSIENGACIWEIF